MTNFADPDRPSPFNAERLPPPQRGSGLGLPLRTGATRPWFFALIFLLPPVVHALPLLALAFSDAELLTVSAIVAAVALVIGRYIFSLRSHRDLFLLLLLPVLVPLLGRPMLRFNDRYGVAQVVLLLGVALSTVLAFLIARCYRESVVAAGHGGNGRLAHLFDFLPAAATAYIALHGYEHLLARPQFESATYVSGIFAASWIYGTPLLLTSSFFRSSILSVLRPFLFYGPADPGAQGVWRPWGSQSMRVALVAATVLVASIGIPASLQWFQGHDFRVVYEPPKTSLNATRSGPALQAIRPEAPLPLEQHRELLNRGYTVRELTNAEIPEDRNIFRSAFASTIFDRDSMRVELRPAKDRLGDMAIAFALICVRSLVAAVVVPSALFLVFVPIVAAGLTFGPQRRTLPTTIPWASVVARLRTSLFQAVDPVLGETIREREHLFLGTDKGSGAPVLLHTPLLGEHCYIVGDSGSGKTSLGIMPLLTQLIAGHVTGAGSVSKPVPIVILDLKGDYALFHTAREEAEKRGQAFRFFTLEPTHASNFYNPFVQFDRSRRTDIQVCQLLLDSLSLNHGEGYGRGYYSKRNRQLLLHAMRHPSKPQTFAELHAVITELAKATDQKDAFELIATIEALTMYEQIRASPIDSPDTIHMPTVLKEAQVVYFWLPAAIESVTAREVGKLALFSLLSAAIDHQRLYPGEARGPVYVMIDEFQRLVGENFRIILEQARSFGISAILANQSISDLNLPDFDLRATVMTNTRVKMFFSIQESQEAQNLSLLSGERAVLRRSWSYAKDLTSFFPSAPDRSSESAAETIVPRLSVTDIRRASDHPLEFILLVSRGSGFSQFGGLPIVVTTTWPMTKDVYARRRDTPWPVAQAQIPPPTGPTTTAASVAVPVAPQASANNATFVTSSVPPSEVDIRAAEIAREGSVMLRQLIAQRRKDEGRS